VWLDRTCHYTIAKFHDDMASKIIWGPTQTLSAWVVDTDTGSEWKIRRDEHLDQMIKDRWDDRLAIIALNVVSKHDFSANVSTAVSTAAWSFAMGMLIRI
jgi:hypothetical protein